MINRPFPVEYRKSPALGSLQVQVTFERSITADHVVDRAVRAAFRSFSRVGTLGGLAGRHIAPRDSTLKLVKRETSGASLICSFRNVAIDAGALVVLENLAHDIHLKQVKVRNVRIVSDMVKPGGKSPSELPSLFQPVPFTYENEAEGSDITADLVFQDSQPMEARVRFEDAWRSWLDLGGYGGFADDTYPPGKTAIYPGDEPQSLPKEIVFLMDDAYISDPGIDSLVNIFHKLHHRVARIDSVEIS